MDGADLSERQTIMHITLIELYNAVLYVVEYDLPVGIDITNKMISRLICVS